MGDLALLIMTKDVRCVIHHPRVESGPGLTRILIILRCRGCVYTVYTVYTGPRGSRAGERECVVYWYSI